MLRAIGIYREFKLAGKPGPDQRILDLTAKELEKKGFEVLTKKPEDFSEKEKADLIFTMARGKEINEILMKKEKEGILVINPPEAIRFSLDRKLIYQKMEELGANLPETKFFKTKEITFSHLKGKSILKPATRHEFWFIVEKEEDFHKAISEYQKEGIEEIVVQEFINGKHLKYYLIDQELILPKNAKKEFSAKTIAEMKKQAFLISKITNLKIFGGDFIIRDETPFLVDANDWPSMSSIEGFTQKEAAFKIANLIEREFNAHREFQKEI